MGAAMRVAAMSYQHLETQCQLENCTQYDNIKNVIIQSRRGNSFENSHRTPNASHRNTSYVTDVHSTVHSRCGIERGASSMPEASTNYILHGGALARKPAPTSYLNFNTIFQHHML